jgi:hypothetical protein
MISSARFLDIKGKHGHYASWAIWRESSGKPKDGVGDPTIFETSERGDLLKQLNPGIVLVGLNISRPIKAPFGNFHDPRPGAMAYKIRYALKGTPLWGAYMTDIIKDFEEKTSGNVIGYLRKSKQFERDNIEAFKAELKDLGVSAPTLIAFGRGAFEILNRHLGQDYGIWRLPHYSNYISKEAYRGQVAALIKAKVRRK